MFHDLLNAVGLPGSGELNGSRRRAFVRRREPGVGPEGTGPTVSWACPAQLAEAEYELTVKFSCTFPVPLISKPYWIVERVGLEK